MKIITTVLLCSVLAACAVRVADIQVQEPIRKIAFTGSHVKVAQCIQVRLRGKVQTAPFEKKLTVYDSAKSYHNAGLTHYAITASQSGKDGGIVEFRKLPAGPVRPTVMSRFWGPVEACVAASKSAS